MEKEFLMNSWPAPLFGNPRAPTDTITEEDNSVFSIWEENYQDLSGWCMEPYRGRCAFPIGEFETNKYSDTTIEDNGVSIKKAVVNSGDSRDFLAEDGSLDKSSSNAMELPFADFSVNSQEDLKPVVRPEFVEASSIGLADVLLDPTKSSIAMRTDDWIQLVTVDATGDSLAIKQSDESSIDRKPDGSGNEYASPITIELPKSDKTNWDAINAFEVADTDSFDLLSYLCDDNVQSPDGSASRDSAPTTKSTSSVASPIEFRASAKSRQARHARRSEAAKRRSYAESSTTSSSIAAITAALDSVSSMSRRSSRLDGRAEARSRTENHRRDNERRGKKRCLDSDSEDRMSDCSYRETREKNNEASRKSRMNKKAKETEMMTRASELERDNRVLKMKVEELEKLVTSMRTTILRSALRKSF